MIEGQGEPRQRGNIIKFVICWDNHPMYKGTDEYWDGSLDAAGNPVSSGTGILAMAHRFDTVDEALSVGARMSTPDGHLPMHIIGVQRTVSWTII